MYLNKFLFFVGCFLIAASVCAQVNPVIADSAQHIIEEVDSVDWDDAEKKDFVGEPDSTLIQTHSFSQPDIDRLLQDPDLNYTQPPTVAESLWDRLMRWINWFLSTLFRKATTTDLGWVIVYTIGAVVLIVIVMMLLKVNAFKVFTSGADQGKQGYNVFEENIHEMNFEKLIQEAVDKREFRLATRLVFLHALKLLSDKHLIDFNPGKTNHDYVEELKKSELKIGLNELSFYFDYAWYGNFIINEIQFQKISGTFSEWKLKVASHA